jgi:hypothetical protein
MHVMFVCRTHPCFFMRHLSTLFYSTFLFSLTIVTRSPLGRRFGRALSRTSHDARFHFHQGPRSGYACHGPTRPEGKYRPRHHAAETATRRTQDADALNSSVHNAASPLPQRGQHVAFTCAYAYAEPDQRTREPDKREAGGGDHRVLLLVRVADE